MYSSYLNRSMIFCMGKLEMTSTDFVKNGFGESWDSSCEKSRVPVHNQWVPVKKNKES